jgi:hypothetical protein
MAAGKIAIFPAATDEGIRRHEYIVAAYAFGDARRLIH